jgi:hypothetical protein
MKPTEKEFCQGVKILLERMKNNPEDFVTSYHSHDEPKFGMFADLMKDVVSSNKTKHWEDWYLFTKAEQTALIEGYKDMMRTRFDQGIMRKLLEEPQEPVVKKEYYGKPLTLSTIQNEALKALEQAYAKNHTKNPTTFNLTPSQVAMANKLGLSPAEYANKLGLSPAEYARKLNKI